MDNLDKIIFGKKKFSDLLKEIYDNQNKKSAQISSLIAELKPLIESIGDATLIVPLIKEYLEIGVKNDEQLVKLAQIIQRLVQAGQGDGGNSGGGILSEEEKKQLLDQATEIANNLKDKDDKK
jgi:hypothetical protein